jgi:hypothetical protein
LKLRQEEKVSKLNKRKQKRDPRGGKSLASHWRDLTPGDRAILLQLIRTYGNLGYDIHMGVLPFISVSTAVKSVQLARQVTSTNKAVYVKLLQKLRGTTVDLSPMIKVRMVLRHARVVKRFGDWIKRGLRIPFAQKYQTTAGLKWSLPHQSYIDDNEAKVFPMFTLNHLKKIDGTWSEYELVCPKTHSNEMKNWLIAMCR